MSVVKQYFWESLGSVLNTMMCDGQLYDTSNQHRSINHHRYINQRPHLNFDVVSWYEQKEAGSSSC